MKDGFADKSCGCGISDKILNVVCNCQGSAPAALWILFVCSKRAIKDKIYFGGSLKEVFLFIKWTPLFNGLSIFLVGECFPPGLSLAQSLLFYYSVSRGA